MVVSGWVALVLSVPVLLLGEFAVRRVRVLDRFNIPAPVAGGLLVALAALAGNLSGLFEVRFENGVSARWWTWLVCTQGEWAAAPVKSVGLPFLVVFFACIGLNASWALLRRGGVQVLLFLGLASLLAVAQNAVGVGLAGVLGIPRALGLMCGSVALTGGHGTVMGFASEFEAAGLAAASAMGAASATFGLVAGGLLGGPVGCSLLRGRRGRKASGVPASPGPAAASGFAADMRALARYGWQAAAHVLLLLACVKLGAWVSLGFARAGVTFPVYMGAMVLGVAARNLIDVSGAAWVRTEIVDVVASVALGVFLTMAMMSLNLVELSGVAGAMLAVLAAQVALVAVFARMLTFRVMGGDYDAAVMAAGQCGFGLGAMPNAVANMKALVEHHGPAPRAFLVVPITGTFLIDLVNATNITVFINLLK